MVFDVTDNASFDDLNKYWMPKVIENCSEPVELALFANKMDMLNERVVSEKQARNLLEVER